MSHLWKQFVDGLTFANMADTSHDEWGNNIGSPTTFTLPGILGSAITIVGGMMLLILIANGWSALW